MRSTTVLPLYTALLWTNAVLQGTSTATSSGDFDQNTTTQSSTNLDNYTLLYSNTTEPPTAAQTNSSKIPAKTSRSPTVSTTTANKTAINMTLSTTKPLRSTMASTKASTKSKVDKASSTGSAAAKPTATSTTSANSQKPLTVRSGGTCELYNGGSICQPYRANETVFVDPDPQYSQDKMTVFLRYLLDQLSSSALSSSPEWSPCYGQIIEGLCRYFFPNCSTTSSGTIQRALICRESCDEVFLDQSRPCTNVFLKAAGASIFFARLKNFLPAHVDSREFGCLSEVLPSQKESNYTCMAVLALSESQTVVATTEKSNVITTCGGTAPPGSHCVFPFLYRGITYTECTTVNSYQTWKPWCSTEPGDYDLLRQWGMCDCSDDIMGVPDGRCEIHKGGSVCDSFRKGQSVFVDSRYNQSYLDRIALQPINSSLWKVTDNEACRSKALGVLCHIVYPDCIAVPNVGAFPAFLCKETCLDLISTLSSCSQPILNFLNIFTSVFIENKLNPVHVYVAVPECGTLLTEEEANGTCMQIDSSGSSVSNPKSEDSSGTNTVVIVYIVVPILAGITLLVLMILLICYKKRSYKKSTLSVNSGYVAATEILSFEKFEKSAKNKRPNKVSVQELLLMRSSQFNSGEYDCSNIPDFPIDKIKYVKNLGEGAFGQVFMGMADLDCSGREIPIAAKVLKQGSGEEVREDFEKELYIMSQLNHRNILQLLAKYIAEEPFCMIFEFMELGDLNNFIRLSKIGKTRHLPDDSMSQLGQDTSSEFKPFTVTVADMCNAIKQVCCGLAYLSKCRFVHRDIATRNCLVGKDLVTKIADFGLSHSVYTTDYYRATGGSLLPIRWMAPESIIYGVFTEKSDVWSFGVLMWEIFTLGKQPYYGWSNEDVITRVRNGTTLPSPDDFCPADMCSFMKQCWIQDPQQRPDAQSLLESLEAMKQTE